MLTKLDKVYNYILHNTRAIPSSYKNKIQCYIICFLIEREYLHKIKMKKKDKEEFEYDLDKIIYEVYWIEIKNL